ncbi:MAG: valine--tRNA ligase [Ginsengibacter sp.]
MELSKNFEPSIIEKKWYQHWMSKGYFKSVPDSRPAYSVVIPPPNVTGVLHMGHTLNETVQDILIRKARMSGFNACWVPGSDHASIATEAKVVGMLKERGIDKNNISREEFLKYAFEWKEKYGNIIYNQIERLGCSVDWDRVSFTMDEDYYKAVIKVFVDLYNKDLIYRGARMINWDPAARTALSDEEVEYRDVTGKLYYIKYFINDSKGHPTSEYIVIATQRPETIMGDVAVCANPEDERYFQLKGSFVSIPLLNKAIPVIYDTYVDKTFGTGILKITPAHDINDYNIGLKHNLQIIDTLNDDGTMSPAAKLYIGEDRFVVRKKIVEELREKGHLVKEEEYTTRLGFSQRTNVVAEPKISTQWFLKMKELAGPALKAVVDGDVSIHPGDKFLATYKYWLENVKDWCISRQLWWGQQIPAWYDDAGNVYVANSFEELKEKLLKKRSDITPEPDFSKFKRDDDVLDTWFSSWLWPIEVFKGITQPGNADINYYYPTSVLVTGQDIIFFWVARMIMSGMEYMKVKPFSDVYFTGMVRDKQGRKMSKSLGNSPDLLNLIDQYGADAVRFGIMISSPAGNDLLFDEGSLEQGKFFNNKIWNALKLIKMWEGRQTPRFIPEQLLMGQAGLMGEMPMGGAFMLPEDSDSFAFEWFENRLNQIKKEVEQLYSLFKLSEALKLIYSLIWDDFCSWYLEWVKPGFEENIDEFTYLRTVHFFEELLQLLHPFMPFVTEEIYHLLKEQEDDLTIKQFRDIDSFDEKILLEGQLLREVITEFRDLRTKNNIKPKEKIKVKIDPEHKGVYRPILSILEKQINSEPIEFTGHAPENSLTLVINKDKFYITSEKAIDNTAQKEQMEKDLEYLKNFLNSVEKKLNNVKFVENAKPEVIALEKKKKLDAQTKMTAIMESLASLK